MTRNETDLGTLATLWAVAGLAGAVAAAIGFVAASLGAMQAIFVGLVVATLVGVVLTAGFRPAGAVDATARAQAPDVATARVPEPVASPASVPDTAPVPPAAPAAAAPAAPAPEPARADPGPSAGGPSAGGASGMVRPAALDAARDGAPDDLKKIKGVGPKLEALLHSLGFYHFDQIAGWTAAEVAWVDENLEGFKGRVSRDDWVAQARVLAAGGETEFSARKG